jgi:CubicO group peptidase (beta-lactamase class C family)
MTPKTSVRWWSVTKLVTAAAVLQLVDRGRL